MAYNALDVDRIVEECRQQLTLEREDLLASRAYEEALAAADSNAYAEEYGHEPYDIDDHAWRGDRRMAAIEKALAALTELTAEKHIF